MLSLKSSIITLPPSVLLSLTENWDLLSAISFHFPHSYMLVNRTVFSLILRTTANENFNPPEQSFHLLNFQQFQTILGSNKSYYWQEILHFTPLRGGHWVVGLLYRVLTWHWSITNTSKKLEYSTTGSCWFCNDIQAFSWHDL